MLVRVFVAASKCMFTTLELWQYRFAGENVRFAAANICSCNSETVAATAQDTGAGPTNRQTDRKTGRFPPGTGQTQYACAGVKVTAPYLSPPAGSLVSSFLSFHRDESVRFVSWASCRSGRKTRCRSVPPTFRFKCLKVPSIAAQCLPRTDR